LKAGTQSVKKFGEKIDKLIQLSSFLSTSYRKKRLKLLFLHQIFFRKFQNVESRVKDNVDLQINFSIKLNIIHHKPTSFR